MVMGGNSHARGCGFKSLQYVMDLHFSHHIVVKIVMFVGKRTKKYQKESGCDPFLEKQLHQFVCSKLLVNTSVK